MLGKMAMAKKVSKTEKLDLIVREISKIQKQLKVLTLQYAQISESVTKLSRPTPRKDSSTPEKMTKPAKKAAPAEKTGAKPIAARPTLVGTQDGAPTSAKLASQ